MSRYKPLDRVESRMKLNWGEEGTGVILLTVGRLEWQKGHEIALRALATLGHLDWKYVIIGSGNESARLARLSVQLGISDRVRFMGRVPDDIRTQALAGADLFIWPERTHPAFGLAGLESLVMGTPVVAARRGAIPELIDDTNGVLFEANDPTALATALASLLGDRARLERLRIGLRERTLARIEPDRMISATLSAYERAIQS